MNERLGIRVDERILSTLKTSPAVRYGEETSSLDQAMDSHGALLALLAALDPHACIEPDSDSGETEA